MSYSLTISHTATFTLTHAKHLASKVAADLMRMKRFYQVPSESDIAQYEEELALFLKAGYILNVTYGFKRNGKWIEPTLIYSVRDLLGGSGVDDDPGRIRPGANVEGAVFHSYMEYSAAWTALSEALRETFCQTLPFRRVVAPKPGIEGYTLEDISYSAGGRALSRGSVRSLS